MRIIDPIPAPLPEPKPEPAKLSKPAALAVNIAFGALGLWAIIAIFVEVMR